MSEVAWSWISRWLLPVQATPRPDGAAQEAATQQALAEADAARRELERLKHRARSVGIDVEISRSWGPHDEDRRGSAP